MSPKVTFYLQITKLKAFEISSVCHFTFLKIEINHWEILEIVWSKIFSLCNDMASGGLMAISILWFVNIVSKEIKAEIGEIIFLSYFLAKRVKSQRGRN
jgi:hypothetical protein